MQEDRAQAGFERPPAIGLPPALS